MGQAMNILCMIPSLTDSWKKALSSVHKQVYEKDNIFVLAIQDNCEAESTVAINGDWQELLWKRKGRQYAAKNIYEGIKKAGLFGLDAMDIVVHIDGDDELYGNSVFSRLQSIYKNEKIWLTHGSYQKASNGSIIGGSYRSGDIFRAVKWKASHLRTYRYGLIQNVPEACYKDSTGEWLKVCVDMATMFPMLEMAGYDRIFSIGKIMYQYNDTLSTNDHRERWQEQQDMDKHIRSLPRFKKLQSLGVHLK